MFTEAEVALVNRSALAVFCSSGVDELCDAVLGLLPRLIPHEKSFFTCLDSRTNRPNRYVRSLTIEDCVLNEYLEHYHRLDYTAWFVEQSDLCVYRDSDLVSPEAMEHSEIYRAWVLPMGMRYCCGNVIARGEVRYGDITLLRGAAGGDFTERELFLFQQVTLQLRQWFERRYPQGYAVRADSASGKLSPAEAQLTPREREVARLVSAGASTGEASERLCISEGTTRKHLANIFAKLGVSSRLQLAKRLEQR